MASENKHIRGDIVAHAVWQFIQQSHAIQLVPWVTDPNSLTYDPIKVAELQGWKRAIAETEDVILQATERAKREVP